MEIETDDGGVQLQSADQNFLDEFVGGDRRKGAVEMGNHQPADG